MAVADRQDIRRLDAETMAQMRERITAGRCVDCDRPVFSLGSWRCDDCAEEHYQEIRDSETPMSCGDEAPDDGDGADGDDE